MIAYLESKTRQLLANSFILKRYNGNKYEKKPFICIYLNSNKQLHAVVLLIVSY